MRPLRSVKVIAPLLLASLGAFACGDSGSKKDDPATDAGGEVEPDAAGESGDFVMLINGDWSLPAGSEEYRCVRKTLSEDTYITSFKSIGPVGTHHTVLTAGPPSGPDGISACGAGTNAQSMIFGSGIGDIEFSFPEGVGIKIPAGHQLLLNLHLFNYGENELVGSSGTLARFASAADVEQEAESVLMGPVSLSIGAGTDTETGDCTMEQDVTLLTVAPHMHELGRHMTVETVQGGTVTSVHDESYDFFDQQLYVFEDPIQLQQGDKIRVHCTYENNTGSEVNFGDSSKQEMCFAGMYRYPKRSNAFAVACFF